MPDVGMPGNIPDIHVYDATGLTDRAAAEFSVLRTKAKIANVPVEMPPTFKARYAADSGLACVRYGLTLGQADLDPNWFTERCPVRIEAGPNET